MRGCIRWNLLGWTLCQTRNRKRQKTEDPDPVHVVQIGWDLSHTFSFGFTPQTDSRACNWSCLHAGDTTPPLVLTPTHTQNPHTHCQGCSHALITFTQRGEARLFIRSLPSPSPVQVLLYSYKEKYLGYLKAQNPQVKWRSGSCSRHVFVLLAKYLKPCWQISMKLTWNKRLDVQLQLIIFEVKMAAR